MKLLIILLALPFVGLGQDTANPALKANLTIFKIESKPASSPSVIIFDTTSMEKIIGWKSASTLYNQPPTFVKIDTTYGLVEYLVSEGDGRYQSYRHSGYKIDSVTSKMEQIGCPNPMGNNMSCLAMHYDNRETRLTFKVIANGREINRYKYYTFIPESQMQKK